MSGQINWRKAKRAKRTAHKSEIWKDDDLATRAKRELRRWRKTLSFKDRRKLRAI